MAIRIFRFLASSLKKAAFDQNIGRTKPAKSLLAKSKTHALAKPKTTTKTSETEVVKTEIIEAEAAEAIDPHCRIDWAAEHSSTALSQEGRSQIRGREVGTQSRVF